MRFCRRQSFAPVFSLSLLQMKRHFFVEPIGDRIPAEPMQ
jgi:hypothetical protein